MAAPEVYALTSVFMHIDVGTEACVMSANEKITSQAAAPPSPPSSPPSPESGQSPLTDTVVVADPLTLAMGSSPPLEPELSLTVTEYVVVAVGHTVTEAAEG